MFSITVGIIVVTSLISFVAFGNQKVQEDLLFWPAAIHHRNQYYRFLTCGFIHFDYAHLIFNMYSLYAFGEYVEMLFTSSGLFGSYGKLFYLALYLSAIVVAVIPDYFIHRGSSTYRSLGASGAVSAIIFSGILLKPLIPLRVFLIPIDIPGFIFAALFLLISVILARTGRGGNIAHGAHFSGAIYGVLFTTIAGKLFADYNAIRNFIHVLRFDWLQ